MSHFLDHSARQLSLLRCQIYHWFSPVLMALAGFPQGCSSKFPTLGGGHCSGRRVPVAA